MEMHQLRYVVAVARTGNFSRAAEECHVAQPSLSQQVLKLEEELGERLFDRTRRETKLTAHGEVFLRRALRVLEEVDAAKREAKDAGDLLRGTVRIGVLPTIAPYLLPGVMAEFSKKYPGVEMEVQEDTTANLVRQVLASEVDFALTSLPIQNAQIEARELFAEELLLALPPGHALARKRKVSLADLADEKLIVMKEGHCLGDQVMGFCQRGDTRTCISFRSAQLETIQSLVRAGMGLSLIPKMAAQAERNDVPEYRSFSGEKPTRMIAAVWARQRPPGRAVGAFIEMAARSYKAMRNAK